MRSAITVTIAILSAAALAACTPSAETEADAADDAAVDATDTTAALEGPAPGLWRLTTTSSMAGMPATPAVETCIAAAVPFDAGSSGATAQAGDCTTQAMHRDGDAMVSGATCTMPGGGTTTTEVRIEGDFSSNYTMTSTVTMDPPPTPDMAEIVTTTTAERIGDCPA